MPSIVPISDLRNYPEVLRNVSKEEPSLYLLNELTKGKKSREEKGLVSSADVRTRFHTKRPKRFI